MAFWTINIHIRVRYDDTYPIQALDRWRYEDLGLKDSLYYTVRFRPAWAMFLRPRF